MCGLLSELGGCDAGSAREQHHMSYHLAERLQ